MIIKGYSIKPVHETDVKVRVGSRERGFLTRHIEYGITRREAIASAIAWINRRAD